MRTKMFWLRLLVAFALLCIPQMASAQSLPSVPLSYLSAGTNNSTLVYGDNVLLKALVVINTNNTIYYLKLYNKRTAPTCGSDTPVWRIPVPANNTGGGFVVLSTEDMRFPLGLGFCLVGGIADSDNTNAATGVALNFAIFAP